MDNNHNKVAIEYMFICIFSIPKYWERQWPSLTKDMQTEQLLCWSGMTDTEHTTTGLNEERVPNC